MKKIYLFLLGTLILSSCDDILEEKPMAIATETFYNTADEVESALFGGYRELSIGPFSRYYLLVNLSQVDYGVGRGSYSSTSNFQGLDPTNIGRTNSIWSSFYKTIRDANIILDRTANNESIDKT